ncbi:hypothetical protein CRUP_029463, partial [Coryphaenoides rupestris]
MDRGGCQLSGGGGGSEAGGGGMITLEDLESFSEEPQDSGRGSLEEGGDEEETATMDEGEDLHHDHDRLLNYWQDIARGHQVEVPQDMAEPIQLLTSNDEGRSSREQVPFNLLTHKEKCGELLYEKRSYEKAHWACITMSEETYEQSICYGFMRLMRYICQQNSTVIHTNDTQSVISRDVTVAYYLPAHLQAQPPLPMDNDIFIEIWPAAVVYTRPFTGPTNEVTIINQIRAMAEVLDAPGVCINDSFIVAGYTNPL